MQPLDKENLFSIFEQGDEQVYQEHNMAELLQNPFVLLGMVLRGIENYQLMDLMYMRNYPVEYKAKRDVIRYKYYDKLFMYLDRIDWADKAAVYKIGESYDLGETTTGLNTLLYYFEKKEMYERCAVIKACMDKMYDASVEVLKLPRI